MDMDDLFEREWGFLAGTRSHTHQEAVEMLIAMKVGQNSRLLVFGCNELFRVALFAAHITAYTVLCVVYGESVAALQRNIAACPSVVDTTTVVQYREWFLRLSAQRQEHAVGIFGATDTLLEHDAAQRLDLPHLTSKVCFDLQSLLPFGTVCTVNDKSAASIPDAKKNSFHFSHEGDGSLLRSVADKMMRRVSHFSLLMLDYANWDGSSSAVERVASFLRFLSFLESKNIFTSESVAIVPNVAGLEDCLRPLRETHCIGVLSKEHCLLYQLTQQIVVADEPDSQWNNRQLKWFGANEFLLIRIKPSVRLPRVYTRAVTTSSLSSLSCSSSITTTTSSSSSSSSCKVTQGAVMVSSPVSTAGKKMRAVTRTATATRRRRRRRRRSSMRRRIVGVENGAQESAWSDRGHVCGFCGKKCVTC
jgi:hypothetical protein